MNRTKWEDAGLTNMQINSIDSKFLATAGLPNLENDELEFFTDPLLAGVDGTDFHRIGTYGILNDVPLYVRETSSGIWTIDDDTNQPMLVNSTASDFSEFMHLRNKYLLDLEQRMVPSLREELVLLVIKAMESIDAPAMEPESLWGPFMEDICNQAAYYGD